MTSRSDSSRKTAADPTEGGTHAACAMGIIGASAANQLRPSENWQSELPRLKTAELESWASENTIATGKGWKAFHRSSETRRKE